MPRLSALSFSLGSYGGSRRRFSSAAPVDTRTVYRQVFNSTNTWTVPVGVTEIDYLIVAGGGGGAGHSPLTKDPNTSMYSGNGGEGGSGIVIISWRL